MQISDIIFAIFGAVFILSGIASMVTGKVYLMGSSAAKYTDESLKKYSRPYGAVNIFTGIGLVAYNLLNDKEKYTMFKIGDFSVSIGLFVLLVSVIIAVVIGIFAHKLLVKK